MRQTVLVAIAVSMLTACGSPDAAAPPDEVRLVARNFSRVTACAEEDNITIGVFAPAGLSAFDLTATHPAYDVGDGGCAPDFAGCQLDGPADFAFEPERRVIFQDDRTIVEGVRVARWFLDRTMAAGTAARGSPERPFAAHFVRLSRRIAETDSIPEVLVVNMDGNVRVKPHAPAGAPTGDSCFGSSVLIGPADADAPRPVAEIATIVYDPGADRFAVRYRGGGEAALSLLHVDRTRATVRVSVAYPIGGRAPMAMLRSMFVAEGNADVDRVADDTGVVRIPDFDETSGRSLFFFRGVRSMHNTSAPDLRLSPADPARDSTDGQLAIIGSSALPP